MNYKRYYKASLIFVVIALCLALFLPARIGTHGDSQPDGFPTEKRYLSLTLYSVFAQKNTGENNRIGTTPYTNFYVRTYAIEIWLLAATLFAIGALKKRRRTN